MYMQMSHRFSNIHTTDDGPRSNRKYSSNNWLWEFLNQFPSDTIKLIWQQERTYTKMCRQNMSILFNEICINEEMLPKYTLCIY